MKKKIQFKIHKLIYADSVQKTEQKIIIHEIFKKRIKTHKFSKTI